MRSAVFHEKVQLYTGCHVAWLLCSCEGRSNSSHGILRVLRNPSSLPPFPPQGPLHVLLEGFVDHEQLLAGVVDHVQLLGGVVDHEQLLAGVVDHEAAAGWGCTPRGCC